VSKENIIIPLGKNAGPSSIEYSQRVLRSRVKNSGNKNMKERNCHYCEARKKSGNYLQCSNYPNCRNAFCHSCLRKTFDMDFVDSVAKGWTCPVCTESCDCAQCEINFQENSSELRRNYKKRMTTKAKLNMKVLAGNKRQASPVMKIKGESKKLRSSDSDSGSLYIPTSERQKKKTPTPEDNLNKKTRNSLRKNDDSNSKDYLEERKEKLRGLESKGELIGLSPQTNFTQQSYPQVYTGSINSQFPIQYLPYQYPYIVPQMPQHYSPMITQPIYSSIPYSMYSPQVYPQYISGATNQTYQAEYDSRGLPAWHKRNNSI